MKKVLTLICLIAVSAMSMSASAAIPEKFLEVSPGIFRSAQPGKEDLKDLKALGIKTILNLNNDKETMAIEKKAARLAGIDLIEHPMSGFWSPDDAQVEESLAVLQDESKYPILVHCKHGEDRTGLIIGLHRVFAEKWTPEDAYQEMLEGGFHPMLVFLDKYYKAVTGLKD